MKITLEAEDIEYGNGICLSCAEIEWGGCEPDLHEGRCSNCDLYEVMGLEQAIIEQAVEVSDEASKVLDRLM